MPRDGRRIKGSAGERARARDRLRAELLAAARTLGEESGGYEKVTIRQVADRVGYTAPVVYEHFANKHALLLGVIDQGFADLADELGQAQCPIRQREAEAPSGRHPAHEAGVQGGAIRAASRAYWRFAVENPHLYRLMSSLAGVPFGTPEAPASAVECFRLLQRAIATEAPEPPADALDEDAATDLFWAHLHGLVMLTLDGRIKGGHDRAYALLHQLADSHRP
ncbi:TetR/AcrR family transcriptional regulator [Thermomonospora umbrina]|uniref:TetR family transcriptional regulator n=1 Tax=Thermomonospora umbrina TaxID=111806 RepID=A0A3D9T047_9ACTN|nr:TetR/AcrR family transcriptional regulator [Thermomonospora umbrina]REE97211.1 TetR family transcriptional regulator [Thermomonospora umbrina]